MEKRLVVLAAALAAGAFLTFVLREGDDVTADVFALFSHLDSPPASCCHWCGDCTPPNDVHIGGGMALQAVFAAGIPLAAIAFLTQAMTARKRAPWMRGRIGLFQVGFALQLCSGSMSAYAWFNYAWFNVVGLVPPFVDAIVAFLAVNTVASLFALPAWLRLLNGPGERPPRVVQMLR
jgi:hypothetical protein